MTEQATGSQETATTQATTETTATQQTQTSQQTAQQSQQTQTANVSYPSDWREKWSGGDDKELKRLQRFTSPDAVFKSFREMEQRFSSAKFKTELPENPTEEQLAAYRLDNNIPAEPAKYYDAIKDIVIGEEDRPAFNKFFEKMHAANAPSAAAQAAVEAYHEIIEEQQAEDVQQQKVYKQEQDDLLRARWGADYRTNISLIKNTLSGMSEELSEAIENAVDGHGNLLFNNADFLEWMGGFAREINPAGITAPGGGGDQVQSIDARLAEFKAMRQKDINGWQRNDALQAEERRLLEAKEKIAARR